MNTNMLIFMLILLILILIVILIFMSFCVQISFAQPYHLNVQIVLYRQIITLFSMDYVKTIATISTHT